LGSGQIRTWENVPHLGTALDPAIPLLDDALEHFLAGTAGRDENDSALQKHGKPPHISPKIRGQYCCFWGDMFCSERASADTFHRESALNTN